MHVCESGVEPLIRDHRLFYSRRLTLKLWKASASLPAASRDDEVSAAVRRQRGGGETHRAVVDLDRVLDLAQWTWIFLSRHAEHLSTAQEEQAPTSFSS